MARSQPAQQTLRLTRLFNAAPEAVFDAWTDPESLRAWFLPGTVEVAEIVCEAHVGGALKIVLQGEHGALVHEGSFVVVERPRLVAFTWKSHATGGAETLVTIEIAAKGARTELVLTHERLPDARALGLHEGGWNNILDALAAHFSR
jgi:uncharacterized protein YndB with AHSA1/START domain